MGKIPRNPKLFSALRGRLSASLAPLSALGHILPLSWGLVQPNRAAVRVHRIKTTGAPPSGLRSPKRLNATPPSRQRGVSLITVVLGMAVAGAVTVGAAVTFNSLVQSAEAQTAGGQIVTATTSAGNYFLARRKDYSGFTGGGHSGLSWPSTALTDTGRNALDGFVCAIDSSATPANPALTSCDAQADTANAIASTSDRYMTLLYGGFESQSQCQQGVDMAAGMPYVEATGCVGATGDWMGYVHMDDTR